DVIRDFHVNGVQTCALPILLRVQADFAASQGHAVGVIPNGLAALPQGRLLFSDEGGGVHRFAPDTGASESLAAPLVPLTMGVKKFGRASCRERAQLQQASYV